MNHLTANSSQTASPTNGATTTSFVAGQPLTASLLGELFQEHAAMLQRVIVRQGVPLSAAEDVASEAWIRVVEKAESNFDGGNFRAWLCQIGRNQAIDWLRRRENRNVALPTEWEHADGDARTWLDFQVYADQHAALRDCVEQLPEPRRTIVRERAQGTEILAIVEITKLENRAQVDRQFHTAKDMLRRCLEHKGFGASDV